jgi:hypothetical protein
MKAVEVEESELRSPSFFVAAAMHLIAAASKARAEFEQTMGRTPGP